MDEAGLARDAQVLRGGRLGGRPPHAGRTRHALRLGVTREADEEETMSRPVTLFTGQWADLPLDELAAKCGAWGFDGLELACWGDHFDVAEALRDPGYAGGVRALLEREGLGCWAIGQHLVGQAVCDPIDDRHRAVLPPEVWGDGDPEGVRQRAAERMMDTARAAARLGATVVTGFTG